MVSGSSNWTRKAEIYNYQNIIVSTDLNLVLQFVDEFDKLKTKTQVLSSIYNTQFGSYLSEKEIAEEIRLINETDTAQIDIDDKTEEKAQVETISEEIAA